MSARPFTGSHALNIDTLNEITDPPADTEENIPDDISLLELSMSESMENDYVEGSSGHEKNKLEKESSLGTIMITKKMDKEENIKVNNAFLVEILEEEDAPYWEYLLIIRDMKVWGDSEDQVVNDGTNLSDLMLEPSSLVRVLPLSLHNKRKWETIKLDIATM